MYRILDKIPKKWIMRVENQPIEFGKKYPFLTAKVVNNDRFPNSFCGIKEADWQ
jgi:hypothetical protein